MGTRRWRFGAAAIAALALSLTAMAALGVAKDRNKDRIPDRWERHYHLSLKVDQARRDQDRDGLRNRGEYRAGTNPRKADSDGDGVGDGDEGAGKISAWDPDTGELTIALFGGGEVTGTVDDETQIECRNDDADEPDEAPPAQARPSGEQEDADQPPAEEGAPPPPEGGHHGGHHGCHNSDCSVDDLAVDGVVREASLKVTSDGLVFVEIQLG